MYGVICCDVADPEPSPCGEFTEVYFLKERNLIPVLFIKILKNYLENLLFDASLSSI